METVAEEEFRSSVRWLRERVMDYQTERERMAIIAGFFIGSSGQTFTAEQITQILDLRIPEQRNERP